MSLKSIRPGKRVRFLTVNAGHRLQGRLAAMGMVPGAEIDVVQNNLFGPVVVEVKGSRMMLGRGTANKILVE